MIFGAPAVCVIIPAWNAEATIGRAVASGLAQAEVAEVLVVDDASTDATARRAAAADDASGRLRILSCSRNGGPAAARNLAIAASTAPFLAILDADDFLLPGRFAGLLATPGWDAIADNLAFITEASADRWNDDDELAVQGAASAPPGRLSLASFVDGNISVAGRPRGELGFLKPLLRRAFLEEHGLRYDENLRLGEDYALYCRLLARGAAFLTVPRCGYVAVERANSLSGNHRTADLEALAAADRALLAAPDLGPRARAAIRRHLAHVAAKARHRAFLDTRQSHGLGTALTRALARPDHIPQLALAIARDKWHDRHPPASAAPPVRYLFA